jgi:hypothetical protein
MPKRSTSYFGVSVARISMSQPLQEPLLKCTAQIEFKRAQARTFLITFTHN